MPYCTACTEFVDAQDSEHMIKHAEAIKPRDPGATLLNLLGSIALSLDRLAAWSDRR